jgi:predicted aconitase
MAQSSIEPTRRYEGTVEYQKTQQPATILEFNYPERDLEKALEDFLEKKGEKVKVHKGFNMVKNVKLHESENRYYDIYYKIEGTGKGDNARSTLYFIVAEPGENILARDGKGHGAAKAAASVGAVGFFGAMGATVGAYDLEKRIKDQQEEMEIADRKLTELKKRKERLEKDMELNTQDINRQINEVDKQKTILEQLKAQKKVKE